MTNEIKATVLALLHKTIFREPYGDVTVEVIAFDLLHVSIPGGDSKDRAKTFHVNLPFENIASVDDFEVKAFIYDNVLHISNGVNNVAISTRFIEPHYDLNCMNLFDQLQKGTVRKQLFLGETTCSVRAFCGMDVFVNVPDNGRVTVEISNHKMTIPLKITERSVFSVHNNVIFVTNGEEDVIVAIVLEKGPHIGNEWIPENYNVIDLIHVEVDSGNH